MADSNDESSKPLDKWKALIAGSATTISIAVFQRKITNKDDLQLALLFAPAIGQILAFFIVWPIGYAIDRWDIWHYGKEVEKLNTERSKSKTTPRRRKAIDNELEWYQKKLFDLKSKSINR